ncbi:MAG: SusD/RagB family nutrient-binding outer membrane lipoprotein [Coprobacter sp.]
MKINIKYKELIVTVLVPLSLLTVHSCYDFDVLREDPYVLRDHSSSTGTDIDTEDNSKYADINLSFKVSKEDSIAYRTDLAGAASTFRSLLYEGYYNDHQITTNLSHDIYAGYVANNQPKHAKKSPDYGYADGWSAARWRHFYDDRSSEYRTLLRAFKFNDNPDQYRNYFYITRIYYTFLALANTDTYGAMPLQEYVSARVPETNNVAYDTQEEVYDVMFRMLEQAVDSIRPEETSQWSPTTDDICYFGDVDKWLRFANTLRLRMALRISNVDPDRAQQEGEAALNNRYDDDEQ